MVRLLIEDITIRKGDQVQLDIRFRGGASKTSILPRPLSFCESHKQNPEIWIGCWRTITALTRLESLTKKGFTTGDGLPLTSIAVGYVRKAYGLKSRFDRLRGCGLLTICTYRKSHLQPEAAGAYLLKVRCSGHASTEAMEKHRNRRCELRTKEVLPCWAARIGTPFPG
jgi:hypothetical protein